jgi:hypothetical protein
MVFAAAHAGDDRYWAAFVADHLRWQDLAEERHEGAGVLIGLPGEVLLAAGLGERIQDHRPQVCAELVGCAGDPSACFTTVGHSISVYSRGAI